MTQIIDKESGLHFDLSDRIPIAIERFSPFELTVGEISLPIKLPFTENNLLILDHPDRFDSLFDKKIKKEVVVVNTFFQRGAEFTLIRVDGENFIEGVVVFETSVFYRKAHNTQMPVVFNVTRDDYTTAAGWVEHMGKVMTGLVSDDFFVFEVLCKDQISDRKYAYLNQIEHRYIGSTPDMVDLGGLRHSRTVGFWVKYDGVDTRVTTLIGHNVTPFLKLDYVLNKIFTHFGYTFDNEELLENPHYQFAAVLNNTADSIVSGSLNYSMLVPTSSVAEFLKSVSVLLGCGFAFAGKTVKPILYNNHLKQAVDTSTLDFTKYIAKRPRIVYRESKSLSLSSAVVAESLVFNIPYDNELIPQPISFSELENNWPEDQFMQFYADTGIRHIGIQQAIDCAEIAYSLTNSFTWPATYEDYNNNGVVLSRTNARNSTKYVQFQNFSTDKIRHFQKIISKFTSDVSAELKVGDFASSHTLSSPHSTLPDITQFIVELTDWVQEEIFPKTYIGEVRRLRSRISIDRESDEVIPECPIMFAFNRKGVYKKELQGGGGYTYLVFFYGSSTHTDILPTVDEVGEYSEMSLHFDGWRGIYYTCYRELSRILLNSPVELRVPLNLPLQNIDYVDRGVKVLISGQLLKPVSIRYELGRNEVRIIEAVFETLKSYLDPEEVNTNDIDQQILNKE
ncbi:MAG: hypothetical protein PHS05_12085 [Bacteroidales bacterium]|nr:hypothetical protein [Bacteroidales bacterium]